MLARCNLCEKTFVTNQFGRQSCPKCGREVFIADPRQPEGEENAYAPPGTSTDAYNPSVSYDEPQGVPWERRAELGLGPALIETLKLALTEPSKFFSQVRPERQDGLLLYFFLVGVIPGWIAAIVQRLISNPADAMNKAIETYRSMGQEDLARMLEKWSGLWTSMNSPGAFVMTLLVSPLFSLMAIYFMAGVSHLVLKLAGKGSAGWNGTFATFIYAYSPGFLNIIPSCGPLIMLTWMTGLQILGLAKVQRISTGMATGAVLAFHALFICAGCGIALALVSTLVAAMGGVHPS
jgi:hypothetical protein